LTAHANAGEGALATALAEARRDGRRLASVEPTAWPADLAGAYRVQHAAAAAHGAIVGWKIAGVTAAQRGPMGVPRPIAAPLVEGWLRTVADGGVARWPFAAFDRPRLECEFAYVLAQDLPPRPGRPYGRAEVEAAIGGVAIGIEVIDTRAPPGAPPLAALADAFNNAAYVRGPMTADWRSVDPARTPIVLADAAGREVARGDGRAVLDGDPLGTVAMLADIQDDLPRGLRAGDFVTTGSCTGVYTVAGPGRWVADFGPLGTVAIALD
jgi:2-keto-4-pentenoate hydratase